MDSKRTRQLEDCVLRILQHGDMNMMTESKIRKLAAEETGFDLTDPANRKVVKRVVTEFFVKIQQDGEKDGETHEEPASKTKAVSRKHPPKSTPAKQPRPKPQRRRLIDVDDDEDEEEVNVESKRTSKVQNPATTDKRRTEVEGLEASDEAEESVETVKVVSKKRPVHPSGRNQTKEVDEDDGEYEPSDDSEEEGKTKRSSKKASKETDTEDEDEDDFEKEPRRVEHKKRPVQKPGTGRRRLAVSDEDQSDEEEEKMAGSSKRKFPASSKNQRRRNVKDETEDEEEEDDDDDDVENVSDMRPKKRPKRKTNDNGDTIICQLSKTRSVVVQDFNGKMLVSIREYYEKEGRMLPTQKGISLTVEQWEAFKEGIPEIEAAIRRLKR